MIKFLILACATWALAASQAQQFDYYDYIDAPTNFQPQEPPPVAARPPTSQARVRAPQAPRPRAPPPSRPAAQPDPRLTDPHFDPNTTPVPILKDSRRIDTKTGAFVYEYAGADGSEKHEWRYSNGTVLGNYTFINDLGERETRVYSAGVFDPNHVDETTDPNYVDLGNYELYKHLEQPYVHTGPSGLEALGPRSNRPQQPRAQPRPAPRPAAPRPSRPPPPTFAVNEAPPPLDFNDASALFEQRPSAGRVFDYEDLVVAPAPPPPAPRRPQPARGSSSRGRQGGAGRARAPEQQESPRHRLDFTGQSPDAILDQFISRFQ